MKLDGSRPLPGRRPEVWLALNDAALLKTCIPGCEDLIAKAAGCYEMRIVASVGPVRARLTGALEMSDVVAGESYALRFDLRGGAAGFGMGEVRVRLQDETSGSSLHYVADARVGGRIAQLGTRLIEGSARKLSEEFFDRFAAQISARSTTNAALPSTVIGDPSRAVKSRYRIGLGIAVVGMLAVAALAWQFA